jgi:hypothetical protein
MRNRFAVFECGASPLDFGSLQVFPIRIYCAVPPAQRQKIDVKRLKSSASKIRTFSPLRILQDGYTSPSMI